MPDHDPTPERPTDLKTALEALFTPFNRCDAPGLSVMVSRGGKTLFSGAYGMASLELGVANRLRTRMRIGSTSKHMTCVAALLLAEEGLLDLDAPASVLLPELPWLRGMPTLRQFMTHTSGYRDCLDLAMIAGGLTVQTRGKFLAAQARQSDVNFAPGDSQLYCNGGYHLLSIAIERASGQSFETVMRERVFEPLGLNDTRTIPNDLDVVPGMATLYLPRPAPAYDGGEMWRKGVFVTEELLGEGGVVSTAPDLCAWTSHLRQALAGAPRIGKPQSWRQLAAPARLNHGAVTTYGLGLFSYDHRGVRLVEHAGGVFGGAASMMTAPDHDLDIAVLTNGAPVSPADLARRIIDLVLADVTAKTPAPKAVPIADYGHLAGARYVNADGLVLGFQDMGGELRLDLQLAPNLRDHGDAVGLGFHEVGGSGPWMIRKSDLQKGPDGGAPATLPVSEAGQTAVYHRLGATPAGPDVLAAAVGAYANPEIGGHAEIALKDGVLALTFFGVFGTRRLILRPEGDRVFGATAPDDIFPLAVWIRFDSTDPISAFDLSTGRTRRLRFTRLA